MENSLNLYKIYTHNFIRGQLGGGVDLEIGALPLRPTLATGLNSTWIKIKIDSLQNELLQCKQNQSFKITSKLAFKNPKS